MEVGREIRRLREAKGWSQAKLAGDAGMGVSGISQIETGARNPSAATLQRIAEALGVEVRDLFPLEQAPLLLPEPTEEQKTAYNLVNYWIDFLDEIMDDWLPKLWQGTLRLEEVLKISRLSFNLSMMYMLQETLLRRWCDEAKNKALDDLEDALEQVMDLVDAQVEEKVRERNLKLQNVPDLTKLRKQREDLADLRNSRQHRAHA